MFDLSKMSGGWGSAPSFSVSNTSGNRNQFSFGNTTGNRTSFGSAASSSFAAPKPAQSSLPKLNFSFQPPEQEEEEELPPLVPQQNNAFSATLVKGQSDIGSGLVASGPKPEAPKPPAVPQFDLTARQELRPQAPAPQPAPAPTAAPAPARNPGGVIPGSAFSAYATNSFTPSNNAASGQIDWGEYVDRHSDLGREYNKLQGYRPFGNDRVPASYDANGNGVLDKAEYGKFHYDRYGKGEGRQTSWNDPAPAPNQYSEQAEQIRQESEQRAQQLQQSIDERETELDAVRQQLRDLEQRANSTGQQNSAATQQLAQQLQDQLAQLSQGQAADKAALQQAIGALTGDFNSRLDGLQGQFAEQFNSLSAEQQQAIAALSDEQRATQLALQNSLNQTRSGFSGQITDLENMLASELEALREYNNNQTASITSNFSNQVGNLSGQVGNLSQTLAESEQKREQELASIQQQLADGLLSQEEAREQELNAIRTYMQDLVSSQERTRDAEIGEIKSALEQGLISQEEARQQEMASIQNYLENLNANYRNEIQSFSQRFSDQFDNSAANIEGLRDDMEARDAAMRQYFDSLNDSYDAKIGDLESGFDRELGDLRTGFDASFEEIGARLEELSKGPTAEELQAQAAAAAEAQERIRAEADIQIEMLRIEEAKAAQRRDFEAQKELELMRQEYEAEQRRALREQEEAQARAEAEAAQAKAREDERQRIIRDGNLYSSQAQDLMGRLQGSADIYDPFSENGIGSLRQEYDTLMDQISNYNTDLIQGDPSEIGRFSRITDTLSGFEDLYADLEGRRNSGIAEIEAETQAALEAIQNAELYDEDTFNSIQSELQGLSSELQQYGLMGTRDTADDLEAARDAIAARREQLTARRDELATEAENFSGGFADRAFTSVEDIEAASGDIEAQRAIAEKYGSQQALAIYNQMEERLAAEQARLERDAQIVRQREAAEQQSYLQNEQAPTGASNDPNAPQFRYNASPLLEQITPDQYLSYIIDQQEGRQFVDNEGNASRAPSAFARLLANA